MTSEEFRSSPLFLRNQFKSDGVFEMPIIRRQNIDLKDVQLIGYDQIKPGDKANEQNFVHLFLDDYKFEVVWNDLSRVLKNLVSTKGYCHLNLAPIIPCRYRCKFATHSVRGGAVHTYSLKDLR